MKKGFTLIELLVVIGVLAVLAAGVVALINPVEKTRQANDAKIQSDMGQLATALNSFAAQQNDGVFPCETAAVTCTQNPAQSGLAAIGPAGSGELSVIPAAPAGSSYTYRSTPATGTRAVTNFIVFAPLLSQKYNSQCAGNAVALGGANAYWFYSSTVGRSCVACGAAGGYANYAAAIAALPACDFL